MTCLYNYRFGRVENTLFYMCYAGIAVMVSMLYYKNIIFAAVFIPFARAVRGFVIDYIIDKRVSDYTVQFKDFLFIMATAIGASRSMEDALSEVIPSLSNIYGDDAVLIKDLKMAYERISVGRENDVSVLYELAVSSRIDDVIDFVTVYSICKVTGSNLADAMVKAANVIMDKIGIEREIEELVKRKEKEGMLLFIMPTLVILLLNFCSPDYIRPLYESLMGKLVMTAAAAGNLIVYRMIRKIIKVEI